MKHAKLKCAPTTAIITESALKTENATVNSASQAKTALRKPVPITARKTEFALKTNASVTLDSLEQTAHKGFVRKIALETGNALMEFATVNLASQAKAVK